MLFCFVKHGLLQGKRYSFTLQNIPFCNLPFIRGRNRLAIPLPEKRHPKGSGWAISPIKMEIKGNNLFAFPVFFVFLHASIANSRRRLLTQLSSLSAGLRYYFVGKQ